ncbi:zinc-binding dehydrogenase [Actinomadura sp. LD22]|uniref:Zinc-binding dehydrogenase n=1 Tax=Actinomadura physcomitrii TaxID=2650748 RepID=A0A6I4MAF4_9ACTN|nr:zinc-binding dehydrogenase [Actinomadura physcomitrii]MWA00781.1 zinc-binding dehydrogenase [Actinomadura physcomitrii]
MRAVWLREFGGPEVLVPGEAPDPVPGDGQVLVAVEYANITFVETQMRAGTGPQPFAPRLPMIPGNGVGGTVAAVGPGTDPGLVGRRVVSSLNGSGGYAELAVVDAQGLLEVPDALGLDEAVALLADGRTATLMVRAARPVKGERVLVEAAAGGVGTLLVQLAKAEGAVVVAAAGGPHKTETALRLGADEAVDYREPGWSARTGPVDVVFDGVGGDVAREAFTLLRAGGRMVAFGLASGEPADVPQEAAEARRVALIRPKPSKEDLRDAAESALREAAAGRLRPVIGQRFPLVNAADAHAAIQSRATTGKTLLEVTAP